MVDVAEAARFLDKYAKKYGAGAFATPTRKDLAAKPESIHEWRSGDHLTIAVEQVFSRGKSARMDWRLEHYAMTENLATHVGRTPGAPVPDFSEFNHVMAYLEDRELVRGLRDQGFNMQACRITASSELIGCFWKGPEIVHDDWDMATATLVQLDVPARAEILDEVSGLTGFRDDWPAYSDGTWGALCLKGFYPEDPGKDMKPTEMPRAWRDEHPEDLKRQCEWTSLAADCPSIVDFVTSVPWWGSGLERVRLLQMSGNNGNGGSLGRHTDIADKFGGTSDGKITRWHIPIVTDPRIKLHTWDLDGIHSERHLEQWNTYYLDARKPHAVTNPTGVDRIHLVVDVVSSPEVRERIADGYNNDFL